MKTQVLPATAAANRKDREHLEYLEDLVDIQQRQLRELRDRLDAKDRRELVLTTMVVTLAVQVVAVFTALIIIL